MQLKEKEMDGERHTPTTRDGSLLRREGDGYVICLKRDFKHTRENVKIL